MNPNSGDVVEQILESLEALEHQVARLERIVRYHVTVLKVMQYERYGPNHIISPEPEDTDLETIAGRLK